MDIWESVKKIIPSGLGFLANAILPGSGGFAASLISDAIGCEKTPEAIESGLKQATPEQISKLREMAFKHEEKLVELAIEQEKAYIHDVQNARLRETEVVKATGKKDWNLYLLAWTVIAGFFGLVSFMIFYKIPGENIGPVNQLFGAIAAGFGVVLAYFFGSSKSSADKNALIANQKKT